MSVYNKMRTRQRRKVEAAAAGEIQRMRDVGLVRCSKEMRRYIIALNAKHRIASSCVVAAERICSQPTYTLQSEWWVKPEDLMAADTLYQLEVQAVVERTRRKLEEEERERKRGRFMSFYQPCSFSGPTTQPFTDTMLAYIDPTEKK